MTANIILLTNLLGKNLQIISLEKHAMLYDFSGISDIPPITMDPLLQISHSFIKVWYASNTPTKVYSRVIFGCFRFYQKVLIRNFIYFCSRWTTLVGIKHYSTKTSDHIGWYLPILLSGILRMDLTLKVYRYLFLDIKDNHIF